MVNTVLAVTAGGVKTAVAPLTCTDPPSTDHWYCTASPSRSLATTKKLAVCAAEIVGWIRSHDQLGGFSALLVYLVLVGGVWLVVSLELPHRDVSWPALLPGAALLGGGLLFVNVFNVYVTTRLVEDRANTYGALGIAAALLFSLVLVGRLVVVSAELNALLDDRRSRPA